MSLRSILGPRSNRRTNRLESEDAARRYYYERLFEVEIFHEYFNDERYRCPAFSIVPTGATTELMGRSGLLWRPTEHGFSVLYDTRREKSLVDFMLRQLVDENGEPVHPGHWLRLTFLLAVEQAAFLNYTGFRLSTNPLEHNFYLSNYPPEIPVEGEEKASFLVDEAPLREGGRLSHEPFVGSQDRKKVTGAKALLRFPPGSERIVVRGISGEAVQCYPRCICPKAAASNTTTCEYERSASDGGVCRDEVYVDLSSLPMDLYSFGYEPQLAPPYLVPRQRLYVHADPTPLCLVDLLFAAPEKVGPGVYPIGWEPEPHIDDGVRYTVAFRNRKTIWRYFVIPRAAELDDYRDLEIRCEPERGAPQSATSGVKFKRPKKVVVADGQVALRFDSRRPLPLLQRYDFRLSLVGEVRETGREVVLADRLAVASVQQIGPTVKWRPRSGDEALAHTSDIYVYF